MKKLATLTFIFMHAFAGFGSVPSDVDRLSARRCYYGVTIVNEGTIVFRKHD